jgi:hypothetical protein
LPIEVLDSEEKNLIGAANAATEFARAMVNPFDITYYREGPGTRKDSTKRTVLEFRNGQTLVIELDINELERRLNNHYEFIK